MNDYQDLLLHLEQVHTKPLYKIVKRKCFINRQKRLIKLF